MGARFLAARGRRQPQTVTTRITAHAMRIMRLVRGETYPVQDICRTFLDTPKI